MSKVPVWELELHDASKIRFRFFSEEDKETYKEFTDTPYGFFMFIAQGRVWTSRTRMAAYEEAVFWAQEFGVQDCYQRVAGDFRKSEFLADLSNFYLNAVQKWPLGDLTDEQRKALKGSGIKLTMLEPEYEVVDEMEDAAVMELGEESRPTDTPNSSTPSLVPMETSSVGSEEAVSEDGSAPAAGMPSAPAQAHEQQEAPASTEQPPETSGQ